MQRYGEDPPAIDSSELSMRPIDMVFPFLRRRVQHDRFLVDCLIHRIADGADEIHAPAELGEMRYGGDGNPSALHEAQAHPVAIHTPAHPADAPPSPLPP